MLKGKSCKTFEDFMRGGKCEADPPLFQLGSVSSSVRVRTKPTEIRPASRLAVCTVATGAKAEQLGQCSLPPMSKYADRCGADLVVLKEDHCPAWPIANKFQVEHVVSQYDRTLFVDVDVWIKPNAPNAFEVMPSGLWMHDDTAYLRRAQWLEQEAKEISEGQEMPKPEKVRCWNSGVVMCDREHAAIWSAPKHPIRPTHTAEQTHVGLMAEWWDIQPMDLRFNSQWWMKGWQSMAQDAWFVHLANMPHRQRLEWMEDQGGSQILRSTVPRPTGCRVAPRVQQNG